MPKTSYTSHFKERTGSTSGEEPVYLLEITHPDLAVPVRIARDNQDVVSGGVTFTAMAFEIQLPDDVDKQLPRAPIQIDNVGRELVQWLEASNGGQGAQVRVMQVMRDTPDVIEYDITMDLLNVHQNAAFVTGELGYEDVLNRAGMIAMYRPDNTPGMF